MEAFKCEIPQTFGAFLWGSSTNVLEIETRAWNI